MKARGWRLELLRLLFVTRPLLLGRIDCQLHALTLRIQKVFNRHFDVSDQEEVQSPQPR